MEANQILRKKMPGETISVIKKIFLIFSIVSVISIIGFLFSTYKTAEYIYAHMGGLGIIGLLATFSGLMARRNNYDYRKFILLGLIIPIILGLFAVGIVFIANKILYCGGSVSLAVAVIILIIVVLRKRNK